MNNVRDHALLSPSSAARWLVCTPSAKLEALEPFQAASTYAAEGSEAHALAEIKLSYMLEQISVEEYDARFEQFRLSSQYYNSEFNDFVNDYCNEVMTIIKEDYKGQEVEVHLEVKVEFSDIVPSGSGTSDVVIIGKNFVHVIDLKFGRGVQVDAANNSQLRLYALGALKKYRLQRIFTEAIMTIIQPRLYLITTDIMPVMDLNNWAIDYVKPRAELAIQGKGELVSGDHCKFCKRRGKCEVRGQEQLIAAQQEFQEVVVEDNVLEPKNMTPEMISRVMTIAPRFIEWFKDVKDYAAKAMIIDGITIPGYKVVEGRSERILTDPAAIAEKLRTAGFSEQDYLEPAKLSGITSLEKKIGKKLFNELCKDYIVKPIGRPTVVAETDRRLAINLSQLRLTGTEFEDESDSTD